MMVAKVHPEVITNIYLNVEDGFRAYQTRDLP